jgi:integrase
VSAAMPRPRPQSLHRERNRHGVMVWYVRIGKGPRFRVTGDFGTPEFQASYEAAMELAKGHAPKVTSPKSGKESLAWMVDRYKDSEAWASLSEATRDQRAGVLARVLKTAAFARIEDIDRASIIEGIDRRKATPAAARHFLKTMRYLFQWAVYAELAPVDPTEGVKSPRLPRTGGWYVWTEDDCVAFEARWPLGTRERLAFDVLLYTGLRRSDAVAFGRQHIGRDSMARLPMSKTKRVVAFDILPPLAASIAAGPVKGLTFIAREDGGPMTPESFGNWFAEIARAVGVPGSAHGLRKAGATRAAQWLTPHELMALYGWADLRMATDYTATANRETMARAAGAKLTANILFPHPADGAGKKEKK